MNSFLRETAIDRLRKFRAFAPDDYYALNPDVAARRVDVDAAHHAIEYGTRERRPLFDAATVMPMLTAVDTAILPSRSVSKASAIPRTIYVLVSSRGNAYMNEIAELLAEDIRDVGVDCIIANEIADASHVDPRLAIVVAPHEFFTQGNGPSWLVEPFATQCIMLNVEQVQTTWFGAGLVPILLARGVADLSAQMTAVWANSGRAAFHYEPSVRPRLALLENKDRTHPLVEALPYHARASTCGLMTERPIDVSFFGTRSNRRDRTFARLAPRLAPYSSYIYFRQRASGPILPESSESSLLRISAYVSSLSKISLNVHRDDAPYFEWHRIVQQGMALGALVITDPCLPHPRFKPNVHFLQDDVRQMPNLIDWVLKTADGKAAAERMVANANSLLRDANYRRASTVALLAFVADAGG